MLEAGSQEAETCRNSAVTEHLKNTLARTFYVEETKGPKVASQIFTGEECVAINGCY